MSGMEAGHATVTSSVLCAIWMYPGGVLRTVSGASTASRTAPRNSPCARIHLTFYWSTYFRPWVISRLIELGISPTCGARLPDGPSRMDLSHCQQHGLLTGTNLQLHHEPP